MLDGKYLSGKLQSVPACNWKQKTAGATAGRRFFP